MYLYGGDYKDIAAVIHNMVGSLTGMICDGAKPDCALKIYSGLETAIFSGRLAKNGQRVSKEKTEKYKIKSNTKFKTNIPLDLRIKYYLISYLRRTEREHKEVNFDDIVLNMMINKN